MYLMQSKCVQNQEINPALFTFEDPVPGRPSEAGVTCPAISGIAADVPVGIKRGRPRLPRYICRHCGRETRLTKFHCCQWCHQPRIPAGINDGALHSAWSDFVGAHGWTHAGTATFEFVLNSKNEHQCLQAQQCQDRFFNRLRWWQPDIAWFSVAEASASGSLHLHWVCWAPNLPCGVMRDAWWAKYHGYAVVGRYTPGAAVYTSKALRRAELHSVGGTWKAARAV